MNKSAVLLLVLVFLSASFTITAEPVSGATPSENTWATKAPMHVARNGLGVAVVDRKIYAIGGSTESGENVDIGGFVGTNEEYDPMADNWVFKASMPTPRGGFAIMSHDGKIYCIGGYNNSVGVPNICANEVYDAATDTWSEKAALPVARSWAIATVVGSRIYLFGGDPDKRLSHVYDTTTDTWTTLPRLPNAMTKYVSGSVFVDKKVLIIDYLDNLEMYDPETDSWSFGASPPSSIYGGDAGATTGAFAPKRVYFLGMNGFMDQGAMPNRIYDPKTNNWTLGAEVPTNRMCFAVAVVNDIIYAIGGRSYTFPYPADVPYVITESAANEAYTPIGYGTPDPDYKPPTPSPSPSSSPSPTQSPEPQETEPFPILYSMGFVAVIILVLLGSIVHILKHKQ